MPVFVMKMQAGLSTGAQRPLPCPEHVPAFPAPFASRTVSKQRSTRYHGHLRVFDSRDCMDGRCIFSLVSVPFRMGKISRHLEIPEPPCASGQAWMKAEPVVSAVQCVGKEGQQTAPCVRTGDTNGKLSCNSSKL